MRQFWQIFGLGMVLAAAGIAGGGCSAPDPGELGDYPSPPRNDGGARFDSGQQNPPQDSGPQTPAEGGTPNAGPFEGAEPYTNKTGEPTNNGSHSGFNADNDPAGRNCLECHSPNATPQGVPFSFGGTVYKDQAGQQPAGAGVEVRVRGADGVGKSAYTDSRGNFFFLSASGAFPAQAKVGVRNGTGTDKTRPMSNPVAGGDGAASGGGCAKGGCHVGSGGQAKIWIAP